MSGAKIQKGPECFNGLREEYSTFISRTFASAVGNGGSWDENHLPADGWRQDAKNHCCQQEDNGRDNQGREHWDQIVGPQENAMWYILLGVEEISKALVVRILTTKSIRLQTEYMGTWRTRITLHVVSVYINDDRLVPSKNMALWSVYQLQGEHCHQWLRIHDDIDPAKVHSCINNITCVDRNIFVVVEGWAWGAVVHLEKLCSGRNPASKP